MILITLNGGYTGSLKLVAFKRIRIGLGSDITNKDQTFPVLCGGKADLYFM